MNLKKKNLTLAAVIFAVMGGNLAFAQGQDADSEELQSFVLDQVVVTATKTEQGLFDANANVSVITAEAIERMHYATLDEALRSIPNVQVFNYGLPGSISSKIRINGSDQVVVLMDGVRMSMPGTTEQFPFSAISDMDMIERIEVLQGAASVLYGGDAKGGVINIITKKDFDPKTKISIAGGNVTKENYKFSTQGKADKLGFRVFGQKYISSDFDDGAGRNWDAHDNNETVGAMLKYDLGEDSNLLLNFNHSDDEFKYYDRPYISDVDGSSTTKHLQIIYNQKISDSAHNVLSYNNYRRDFEGTYLNTASNGSPWNRGYKMWSINDTFTKKFGNTHVVTAGFERIKVDYENNDPKYTGFKTGQTNAAYFLQDEWKFNPKWKLTSGVRYDHPSETDDNYSKSFNLGYKFNDKSNMYVAYNDYFVLPTMDQLYGRWGANPDLLPEKGKNYEIGFNHMLDNKTSLSTHYFYRKPDRIIGYDANYNYVNADNVQKVHGWDIQLDRQFDKAWHANIGYARLSYENAISSDAVYLPKNLITLGVDYSKERWDVGLEGRGFIGRVNYGSVTQFPTDNYWVFNLGANYKATENIKVFAKLNNIFDQEYAEQTNVFSTYSKPGDWYGMPGRNFIAGVEVSF